MVDLAEAIRKAQRDAPVDLKWLLSELGVKLHAAYLDGDVSGELVPLPDGRFQINVNAAHSLKRQRFTVAHELGHYIRHRHLIGSGIGDDRAYRSTDNVRYHNTAIGPREESEANKFASSLLMPDHLIDRLKRMGKTSPEDMADALQVSLPAMRIRLGMSSRITPSEGLSSLS
jgi:hypothetical protein